VKPRGAWCTRLSAPFSVICVIVVFPEAVLDKLLTSRGDCDAQPAHVP
jgi:hypothetical protein